MIFKEGNIKKGDIIVVTDGTPYPEAYLSNDQSHNGIYKDIFGQVEEVQTHGCGINFPEINNWLWVGFGIDFCRLATKHERFLYRIKGSRALIECENEKE